MKKESYRCLSTHLRTYHRHFATASTFVPQHLHNLNACVLELAKKDPGITYDELSRLDELIINNMTEGWEDCLAVPLSFRPRYQPYLVPF